MKRKFKIILASLILLGLIGLTIGIVLIHRKKKDDAPLLCGEFRDGWAGMKCENPDEYCKVTDLKSECVPCLKQKEQCGRDVQCCKDLWCSQENICEADYVNVKFKMCKDLKNLNFSLRFAKVTGIDEEKMIYVSDFRTEPLEFLEQFRHNTFYISVQCFVSDTEIKAKTFFIEYAKSTPIENTITIPIGHKTMLYDFSIPFEKMKVEPEFFEKANTRLQINVNKNHEGHYYKNSETMECVDFVERLLN